MRKADLRVGDRVYVVLPHDGGRGMGEIIDLDATPRRFDRKSHRIRILFDAGSTVYQRDRNVSASRIMWKEDERPDA